MLLDLSECFVVVEADVFLEKRDSDSEVVAFHPRKLTCIECVCVCVVAVLGHPDLWCSC